MDAGFEGEYCQQLILLSDTFMYQLITRLLISILQSLDPFIFFKTGSLFHYCYMYIQCSKETWIPVCPLGKQLSCFACLGQLRLNVFGRFRFFRIGRLDHCWTSQLATEIGFFQRVLLKNHLLRAYYLGFDWSGWIVLIKSEILITMGMVCPVSSDKQKAPWVNDLVRGWIAWTLPH